MLTGSSGVYAQVGVVDGTRVREGPLALVPVHSMSGVVQDGNIGT